VTFEPGRSRSGHNDGREKPGGAVREVGEGAAARGDEADVDDAEHVRPAELGPREPAGGGVATQGTLNGQGSTGRGRRRRRPGVGADASDVFLAAERVAGADASDVFLVDVRSEQRREPDGVDAADRGEVLAGPLGAVDQVGLALAVPLVDALSLSRSGSGLADARAQRRPKPQARRAGRAESG